MKVMQLKLLNFILKKLHEIVMKQNNYANIIIQTN